MFAAICRQGGAVCMSDQIDFGDLNEMSAADFVSVLSDIFEGAPWVAERVVDQRAFKSIRGLHQALAEAVSLSSDRERMALIDGYKSPVPESAGRVWKAGSTGARSDEWLKQLDEDEQDLLAEHASAYESRFGFAFIDAGRPGRKNTAQELLAAFEERLAHTVEQEQRLALRHITEIARLRLKYLLHHDSGEDDGG